MKEAHNHPALPPGNKFLPITSSNMHVLITGADGFIGSHLTEALVRQGHIVRAFVLYDSFNSWGWFVTGIPTVLMYVMSTWALISMTWPKFFDKTGTFAAPREVVPWIGVVLLGLAALMLVEAIAVLTGGRSSTPPQTGQMPAVSA